MDAEYTVKLTDDRATLNGRFGGGIGNGGAMLSVTELNTLPFLVTSATVYGHEYTGVPRADPGAFRGE